jgi:hypothetical protein
LDSLLEVSLVAVGSTRRRSPCGLGDHVEQHLVMTETVPARPFDDIEALA